MAGAWVERREVLAGGRSCTHALVIGVSAYEYLTGAPAGLDIPVSDTFGLGQLRSAAASAWAFASWLADAQPPPGPPLGTIRLLLSPSAEEEAGVPGLRSRGPNVLR